MKLYKLILDHNAENIAKEFYIVSNSRQAALDHIKTLNMDQIDFHIVSIKLITNEVVIR